MKVADLKDNIKNYESVFKITDFENFFNIYNLNSNYSYNLNATLYFNIPENMYSKYTLKYPMHWTQISYNIYNTTRLAWLLMKANNVKQNEVFNIVQPGTKIRYLSTDKVKTIIEDAF